MSQDGPVLPEDTLPQSPAPLPSVEEVVDTPRQALPPKPYPGFWQAVGLFAIWMAVSVVVVLPAAVADSIQKNQHQEITTHPAILGLATIASSITVF